MRVAIESSALATKHPTGIARYITELCHALSMSSHISDVDLIYKSSKYLKKKKRQTIPIIDNTSNRFWIDNVWPRYDKNTVVHGTDHRQPQLGNATNVSTMHDLYAYVGVDFVKEEAKKKRQRQYQEMVNLSHRVICVSENTKKDLLTYLDYDASKIDVVHSGVSEEFFVDIVDTQIRQTLEKHGIDRPFILFVGQFKHSKNIQGILESYASSGIAKDAMLVCVGAGDVESVKEQAAKLKIEKSFRVLSYLSNDEIHHLYRAAKVFFFPSLYEGFGLPILEAMATHTPVVTTNYGATKEIANGNAVLVDPKSIDSMGKGLFDAINFDEQQIKAARSYAETKTWLATANGTIKSYQQALKDRQ